VILSD